jgi:predicted GH43/DUF377 family glycosyl hydrolase
MIKCERLGVKMAPKENGLGRFARFNPGVLRENDVVHMLYRATNSAIQDKARYVSTIGYARLDLDGRVLYDSDVPVISPRDEADRMGCEDPRILEFEGRRLVFYTAYSGKLTRVAVDETRDFTSFDRLGLIGHELWDKDAFIIPGRVSGGRVAYLHRVEPDIQLEFASELEDYFDPAYWKDYPARLAHSVILRRQQPWEERKIGGSLPPVPTDRGWLFITHGVTMDYVYRAGAVLLDREDPRKVLGRLPYPILEPVEPWEREGDVPNVVFPEGVYERDGYLYIYYGAADKYIALARIGIDDLVAELLRHPPLG